LTKAGICAIRGFTAVKRMLLLLEFFIFCTVCFPIYIQLKATLCTFGAFVFMAEYPIEKMASFVMQGLGANPSSAYLIMGVR